MSIEALTKTMSTRRNEKEMRPGGRGRRLQAIFSVFLAVIFSFSSININSLLAQNRSARQEILPATGKNGKKAGTAGAAAAQKTGPAAVRASSQATPSRAEHQASAASIRGIPEATLKILKENKFLEEEFKLARSPRYYFVLNLKEKTLELRARGMVLKSWKASELRYSGKPVPLQVTTLTHKTALNPPERKVLNPAEQQAEEARKAEEQARRAIAKKEKENSQKPEQPQVAPVDTFEVEALEITDMPGSYELNFDDGLRIFIRSKSGFKEKFRQARETLLWNTWYPVKHFLNRKSELRPQLILYFDNLRDAQGIYWSFIDGLEGIIWFP
ncbi:MAG: hypothetical protein QME85_03450 [Candidatus Saccharicenans sp.]|nr:hypothetical protein [Candidatus Saccharicenans sp.]